MDVRWVTAERIEDHQVKDLKALLEHEDGFAWVDIPSPDALDAALRDTRLVLDRLKAGRLRPSSPLELSYAIVSSLARGRRWGRAETQILRKLLATETAERARQIHRT
jgi:hypothetical protein